MKKKENSVKTQQQLFFDEKGAWIYYPVSSDGSILKRIGSATFIQKGCVVRYEFNGDAYEQKYNSEQEARYEMRVWIRSYMKGEFK